MRFIDIISGSVSQPLFTFESRLTEKRLNNGK